MITPELHSLLSDALTEAPSVPKDAQGRLNHNRTVQQLLMDRAVTAAEEKWPGFIAFFNELVAREKELMKEAGPQA
jgi:hypothetical protein